MSSSNFQCNKVEKDGAYLISFVGRIDDRVDFKHCVGDIPPSGNAINVDCKGVEGINSIGIKSWITFFKELAGQRQLHFFNCPPALVRQINQVANFTAGGEVHSLGLNYLCEACDEMSVVYHQVKDLVASNFQADTAKCEHCGEEAELDDLPDSVFGFLKR